MDPWRLPEKQQGDHPVIETGGEAMATDGEIQGLVELQS
jgi:hypothetical protein